MAMLENVTCAFSFLASFWACEVLLKSGGEESMERDSRKHKEMLFLSDKDMGKESRNCMERYRAVRVFHDVVCLFLRHRTVPYFSLVILISLIPSSFASLYSNNHAKMAMPRIHPQNITHEDDLIECDPIIKF